MDNQTLQSLLGGSNGNLNITPSLDLSAFAPLMIGLTVVSILITILYLVNVINHWRVNSAILEMRKLLREITERERARNVSHQISESPPMAVTPATSPETPPPSDDTTATE